MTDCGDQPRAAVRPGARAMVQRIRDRQSIHQATSKRRGFECGQDGHHSIACISSDGRNINKSGLFIQAAFQNRMMQLRVSSPADLRLAGFVSFIDDQTPK